MNSPISRVLEYIGLVSLLSVYPFVGEGAPTGLIVGCLVIFYAYALRAVRHPTFVHPGLPTYLTIEVAFLSFYYVIFYWPYQPWVLGLTDLDQSYFLGYTFSEQSGRAVLLATIGLIAFEIGIRRRTLVEDRRRVVVGVDVKLRDDVALKIAPLVVMMQLVLMLLYVSAGWRSAGEGRYTDTISGGLLAEGVALLIIMLCMMAVAITAAARVLAFKMSPSIYLGAILALVWAGRLLLLGDRNSAYLILLAGVIGLVTFCIRVNRTVLIGMAAIALLTYSAVAILRVTPDVVTPESVWTAFNTPGNAEQPGDSSFNISTIGLRAALEGVPDEVDYGYGVYKLIGFAGIVPLVRGYVIDPDLVYTTTSQVLGGLMLGPSATWGVGTNVLADIYIDFGVIGVPVLMLLIGLFGRRMQEYVQNQPRSAKAIILYIISAALLAELPRYSVDFPVRILVWSGVVLLVFETLVWTRRSGRRRIMAKRLGNLDAGNTEASLESGPS